jgi:hypothetical protein
MIMLLIFISLTKIKTEKAAILNLILKKKVPIHCRSIKRLRDHSKMRGRMTMNIPKQQSNWAYWQEETFKKSKGLPTMQGPLNRNII